MICLYYFKYFFLKQYSRNMEPVDPNFLVQKTKKERTPAQKLATQHAFEKLKEKREAMKEVAVKPSKKQVIVEEEDDDEEEEIVEVKKVVRKKALPVAHHPVHSPPPPDDMVDAIVSRLRTEFVPVQPRAKPKKKVVVVESESESSEEEVVVVKSRKPKPVQVMQEEKPKPVEEEKPFRSSGSRVFDKLFYNK